jgi:hypothetical protein
VFSRWTVGNFLVRRYFGEYKQDQSTNWRAVATQNAALDALIGGAGSNAATVVDKLIANFIGHSIDAADRTALINYIGGASATVSSTTFNLRPLVGVLIASPYFQWR